MSDNGVADKTNAEIHGVAIKTIGDGGGCISGSGCRGGPDSRGRLARGVTGLS
jgi:hypothetical protein